MPKNSPLSLSLPVQTALLFVPLKQLEQRTEDEP